MVCEQDQNYPACFVPDLEEKDYGRTWGDLLADDEMIQFSVWVITCEDETIPLLVVSSQGTSISIDGKYTSIFIEGGTFGLVYKLTNNIQTLDDAGNIRKYSRFGFLTVVEE